MNTKLDLPSRCIFRSIRNNKILFGYEHFSSLSLQIKKGTLLEMGFLSKSSKAHWACRFPFQVTLLKDIQNFTNQRRWAKNFHNCSFQQKKPEKETKRKREVCHLQEVTCSPFTIWKVSYEITPLKKV